MSSAQIEVSASNGYIFTNASNSDVVIYPTLESQNILMGSKSNANAGILVSSSNIAFTVQPSNSNGSISFYGGNSNQLVTILGSGNFGIGKSNPAYPLDVAGDINFTGTFRQNGTAYVGSQWSNTGCNVFLLNSNVGIGTTTPSGPLQVVGKMQCGDAASLSFGVLNVRSSNEDHIGLTRSGISSSLIAMNSNGDTAIHVNKGGANYQFSNVIYIQNSTGNVGIGKVLPAYNLDVLGDINFTGSLRQNGTTFGGSGGVGWAASGSNIYSNSNIGIGTSTPSYPLHVQGSIYATADVFAYSDARYKTDLLQITNAVSKLKTLAGYTYNIADDDKRHTGLLAQDVEQVLPEAITYTKEGRLGLAYGNMAGLFVEAFKEIDSRLSQIETSLQLR